MKYYVLEPEVAGGLGPSTVMDYESRPYRVIELEYRFDDWTGEDIVTSWPVYVVTKSLASALSEAALSGFRLAPLKVTKSGVYRQLRGLTQLPEFAWLQIEGKAFADDFGIWWDESPTLVVSERVAAVLRGFKLGELAQMREIVPT